MKTSYYPSGIQELIDKGKERTPEETRAMLEYLKFDREQEEALRSGGFEGGLAPLIVVGFLLLIFFR